MRNLIKVSRRPVETAFQKGRTYLSSLAIDEIFKAGRFKDRGCTQLVKEIDIILPGANLLSMYSAFVDTLNEKEAKQVDSLLEIVKERGNSGTVNYFYKSSDKSEKLPDDLDDTIFCMRALNSMRVEPPVKFFTKLIQIEEKEGGPYKTWFLSDDEGWKDIDPFVNANLYAFSSEFGISLKGLEKYLFEQLNNKSIVSPYYPGRYFFTYLMAKGDKLKKKHLYRNQLIEYLKELEQEELDILDRVFKLLSLIYIDAEWDLQKDLDKILEEQNEDGSFPAVSFCHGYAVEGKNSYVGSNIITTTFVLELLNQILYKTTVNVKSGKKSSELKPVLKKFNEEYPGFYLNFGDQLKIAESVYLVIKDFKKDLSAEDIKNVNLMIYSLILGWGAYTILDDFLDSELLDKKRNIIKAYYYLNECWGLLYLLFRDQQESYIKIKRSYNEAIEYYLEETEKIPTDYEYIKRRMSPFSISIAELIKLISEEEVSKKTLELVKELFYLKQSIDQFSDDAHDLKKDYSAFSDSKGLLGSVIISKAISEGEALEQYKDLKNYFWERMCNQICKTFLERADILKKELDDNSNQLTNTSSVLNRSIGIVEKALEDNKNYKDLILNI